jgi:hypothetical protein
MKMQGEVKTSPIFMVSLVEIYTPSNTLHAKYKSTWLAEDMDTN